MKSEWEFPFDARDVHFGPEHRFVGTFSAEATEDAPAIEGVDVEIRIVPDEEQPAPHLKQTGSLYLTIPMRPEAAEEIAYAAARGVAEQISFTSGGDFEVSLAWVACKRIPETEVEAAEIDGKPYSVKFHMKEVVAPPAFDGRALSGERDTPVRLPLIAQYNETKRLASPIQRFVGFFRILESASYPPGVRASIKEALRNNASLRRHLGSIAPDRDFESFVSEIADVRHECAHLKLDAGFGIDPLSADVGRRVVPLLPLLQELAFRTISKP